jgi:hypothetical protein
MDIFSDGQFWTWKMGMQLCTVGIWRILMQLLLEEALIPDAADLSWYSYRA